MVSIRVDRGDLTIRKSSGEEAPFVPKTPEVNIPRLPAAPPLPPEAPAPGRPPQGKMPPLQRLEQ